MAAQALLTRLIFGMARDNQLPFAHVLSSVSPRRNVPIPATLVSAIVPMLIMLIGLGNAKLFQAVVSIALILVYLAYLCVTFPTLRKRLSGWPANETARGGSVRLGRWGLAINIVAVAWGAVMAVNLAWPRAEFFGPAWYQQYVAMFMIPGIAIVGAAYYWALAFEVSSRSSANTVQMRWISCQAQPQREAGNQHWVSKRPDHGDSVRCRLGVRICHLNCGDSADPGTSRVYLEAASPPVSACHAISGRADRSPVISV